jgi:hypothetical protein
VLAQVVDPTAAVLGAYPATAGRAAQPFFQDQNIVLSRPAHLRDYQGDSAAYPFRQATPDELSVETSNVNAAEGL